MNDSVMSANADTSSARLEQSGGAAGPADTDKFALTVPSGHAQLCERAELGMQAVIERYKNICEQIDDSLDSFHAFVDRLRDDYTREMLQAKMQAKVHGLTLPACLRIA
jgi:DNA-binding ferritin-like protein